MKYIFMYLLCGSLWSAWIITSEIERLKDDEAEEIYDRVKKTLFKSGLVLDNVSVRKLLYSFAYLYFMFTWPKALFKICVVSFIQGLIGKKK